VSRTYSYRFLSGPALYELHPEAAVGLNLVWNFIAEDDPDAADRLIGQIHAAIEGLVQSPSPGYRRQDLHEELLFQTVGNYLIAYVPDRTPLLVVAILYGHRQPHTLAAKL
jgi:toxin ParE1/3/4